MALVNVGDRETIEDGAVFDGTATCPHVHRWAVRWFMRIERVLAKYGTYPYHRRIVEPAYCPTCAERYDQIER